MLYFCFFFFNDTATTEIYTLSLHDALPICRRRRAWRDDGRRLPATRRFCGDHLRAGDRKSTRLNSSHQIISYAVFCLKKKKRSKTHKSGCPASLPPSPPRTSTTDREHTTCC